MLNCETLAIEHNQQQPEVNMGVCVPGAGSSFLIFPVVFLLKQLRRTSSAVTTRV